MLDLRKQIETTISEFEAKTDRRPSSLYLGRYEIHTLKTLLNIGAGGKITTYEGCSVYEVDAYHHFNVV